MTNIYQEAVRLIANGQRFALAILVDSKGSTPQKKGAKAIFLPDGRCLGTLGGGCLEMEAKRRAILALEQGEPALCKLVLDHDFGWDDGLICGGAVELFIDPHPEQRASVWKELAEPPRQTMELRIRIAAPDQTQIGQAIYQPVIQSSVQSPQSCLDLRDYVEIVGPRPVLLIAGAGHVSQATARMAAMVDFEVVVVDDRAAYASPDRFPEASRVIVSDPAETTHDFPVDENTYLCIVTRGHRNDARVLRECIASTAAYIGMIGSRRKIRKIFEEFLHDGIATEKQLARVHSPIGLEIGSETVEEIALSIVAQLVQVRAAKRKNEG